MDDKKHKDLIEAVLANAYTQELAINKWMKDEGQKEPTDMIIMQRTTMAILLEPLYSYMRAHKVKELGKIADFYESITASMLKGGAAKVITKENMDELLK